MIGKDLPSNKLWIKQKKNEKEEKVEKMSFGSNKPINHVKES